jgi:hypothetical protein
MKIIEKYSENPWDWSEQFVFCIFINLDLDFIPHFGTQMEIRIFTAFYILIYF